jgi:hypothetical protein
MSRAAGIDALGLTARPTLSSRIVDHHGPVRVKVIVTLHDPASPLSARSVAAPLQGWAVVQLLKLSSNCHCAQIPPIWHV